MKNKVLTVLLTGMILTMTACGSSNGVNTRNNQTNQVEQVLSEQTSDSSAENTTTDDTAQAAGDIQSSSISQIGNTSQVVDVISADEMKGLADSDVDIDLTQMTSDMVYASVYNITYNPDEYLGSTIRMEGQLVYSYSEETGLTYANVVIADATSCCAQGIEFQLGDGSVACPEGYPEEGSEIVVTGTLETYLEGDAQYLRAGNSTLSIDNT